MQSPSDDPIRPEINPPSLTPATEQHPPPAPEPRTEEPEQPRRYSNRFRKVTKAQPVDWQKAPNTNRCSFYDGYSYFMENNHICRAQSHLANERTYLAWLRTGFTAAALGIACARFGGTADSSNVSLSPNVPITGRSLASGILLVVLGVLMIAYGTYRYKRIQKQLEAGFFIIGSQGVELPLATVIILAVLITAVVLLFA